MVQQMFSPSAALGRETMITQLTTQPELLAAADPRLTLGGYGKTTLEVLNRQIIIDARLSMPDEFVTMARARVKKGEDEFHDIAVTLGDHSLLSKVHDQDGRIVTDWQTMLSLAMLMRYARVRPKSL